MSERTFRAVVALVLVGALALAIVVATATLYRPTPPSPEPSASPPATREPNPTASPFGGPVFRAPSVVSVGLVQRGADSGATLQFEFLETQPNAIPNAPGSFRVVLTDASGDGSTVAFTGTPTVVAPGSFGATATLHSPNILLIEIVAADTFNVEAMTISGLGITVAPDAAAGPIVAQAAAFGGALAGGLADDRLASPGTVVGPG